jgi:hypothetical protein
METGNWKIKIVKEDYQNFTTIISLKNHSFESYNFINKIIPLFFFTFAEEINYTEK